MKCELCGNDLDRDHRAIMFYNNQKGLAEDMFLICEGCYYDKMNNFKHMRKNLPKEIKENGKDENVEK